MTYPHDGYSEDALDTAMSEGGSGKYLSMKSGEPAVMVTVFGRPFIEAVFWNGDTNVPFDPMQHPANKKGTQISLNVWNHKEKRVQILQGGKSLLIAFMGQRDRYGKPTGETTASGREVKTMDHLVFYLDKTGAKAETRFNFNYWPNADAPSPDKLVPYELHEHGALAKSQRNGGGVAAERVHTPTVDDMVRPAAQTPDPDLPF